MRSVESGETELGGVEGRDPRAAIVANLGRDKYIARMLLQRLLRGEPEAGIGFHRYLFRTADVINLFANLACHLLITGGALPPRDMIGTLDRVRQIYDPVAGWLRDGLVAGKASLPPVNDPKGIVFVSVVLDTAEAHLSSIGAHDLAVRVASLRVKVEVSLLRSGPDWILSSTYLRHVGHLVYMAALIELQRRDLIAAPPPRVLNGPCPNAALLSLLAPSIEREIPAGNRYVELISARKRHLRHGGRVTTMSESVSEAATLWAQDRPFAALPDELRRRGEAALVELGIAPEIPIVTLHVRDAAYNRHIAWDMALRDGRIDDYREAVAWLGGRGIRVVRLGDPSMRQAAPHEGLIDYPFTAAKSDWMDVYLASRCRFHIGTASGMSFVPLLFGRPVLMTNWITPAHMICSPSVVTLPKLLLDRSGIPVPMAVWCDRYRDLLERPDADLDGLMLHDNLNFLLPEPARR